MKKRAFFNFAKTTLGSIGLLLVVGLLALGLYALLTSRNQQNSQTIGELQKSGSQSLIPTPTNVMSQTVLTGEWQLYNSRLGYSIKYPPSWFAAPDPGIIRGDILYEKESFLKIRSGEVLVDRVEWASYFYVGIQQFTFDNLNLAPTNSIEKVIQAIDGNNVKVYKKESTQGDGTSGLLQVIELHKQYSVKAYFIANNRVYMIYSSLPNPQDSYRLELFKKITSSIQFPK